MKIFGRASVSEFLGDLIVYRNLVPVDQRLPGLDLLRREADLPDGRIPRKSEAEYARVIVQLLARARALETPESRIARLLFIGDTRLNDGTAFANICRAGGWPGIAFIGSETAAPPQIEIVNAGDQTLFLSNKWAAMTDFDQYLTAQNFIVDEATAVIVDLDKTALGARGRNAHVIDQARVAAVRQTVAGLLGDGFDAAAFGTAYDRLNQVAFHPFTTDNQDYLAYICLILGSGLYDLDGITRDIGNGRWLTFRQFIDQVDEQAGALPGELATIHEEIYANVTAGDPTPFKPFRRTEYLTTVQRMGQMADDTPLERLLAEEIVITEEVRARGLAWRADGALLMGLSDKPDEASMPPPELAQQGYVPIHATETHSVGSFEEAGRLTPLNKDGQDS